jgi:hypothetical protein
MSKAVNLFHLLRHSHAVWAGTPYELKAVGIRFSRIPPQLTLAVLKTLDTSLVENTHYQMVTSMGSDSSKDSAFSMHVKVLEKFSDGLGM